MTLVAIALAGGCGGKTRVPAPTTPAAAAPVLQVARPKLTPGETITWTVTFAGLQAAQARMAVGQAGGREIVVRAEAQNSGLLTALRDQQEVVTSWMDVETGLPTKTEFFSIDGEKTNNIITTRVDGKAQQVIARNRRGEAAKEPETRVHEIPPGPVYDNLSGLAVIRAWDPKPGERAIVWVFSGSRLWRTVLTMEREEDLDTELGVISARKLVGLATRMTPKMEVDKTRQPREFTMWISRDERRIVLRIEGQLDFGVVVVKATSYEAGERED